MQALAAYVSQMTSLPIHQTPNIAVNMTELRTYAQARAGPARDWSWVLSSGTPADNAHDINEAEASVLITGHNDGTAILWDMASEVPAHMYSIKGGCSRQVSTLHSDFAAGLLLLGHEKGQVCGRDRMHPYIFILTTTSCELNSLLSRRILDKLQSLVWNIGAKVVLISLVLL